MDDNRVTYFGITDARNQKLKFGIHKEDRLKHMYVVGKTGMGKSTLLENMAIQDIQNGEGLAFLDPHGKTVDLLMEYVPEHRIKDVIYVAPFDLEHPIAFNVLEDTSGDAELNPVRAQLIVSGLMSTFKKIWEDQWSARMEYILNYTLLALLEIPEATLLDVNRMLSDKKFRNEVISKLKEPTVKMYWEKEFAGYTEKTVAEAVPAIQNKVGQFISNSLIRNIIGQKFSSFDLRRAMDEKKIVLFNLSIGRIGEDAVNLLGSLFVTKIYLAAMSRADISDRDMKHVAPFYLYVDEFQNFTNDSFAQILAQSRKYKLGLIVAHQYVKQMSEVVHDAVFGNVGTMIAFRVGAEDGEALEKEFQPTFTAEDFVNLGRFQMYLKLMINSVTSGAFSAIGLGSWPEASEHFVEKIMEHSRSTYARPRALVEKHILEWTLGSGGNNQPANNAPNNSNTNNSNTPRKTEPHPEPRLDHGHSTQQPPQKPRQEQRSEQRHEQAPRHEPVNHVPRPPKPVLASTPRYINPIPVPEIPSSPKKQVAPPAPPHVPHRTPAHTEPRAPRPQPVHNPFKQAFQELEQVGPEVTEPSTRVEPPAPAPKPVQPVEPAPQVVPLKKEVDADTLKNILGV